MSNEDITTKLDEIGATLAQQPTVRGDVLRQITRSKSRPPILARPRFIRRMLGGLIAVAACLVLAFFFPHVRGIGAQEAFAQAIASVARAHTFSCRGISQYVQDNGKMEIKETAFMFKEPDHARIEFRAGWPSDRGVTIDDYTKHRRLNLNPKDKIADMQDMTSMYAVDPKTGQLKPQQLDTDEREKVLKITAQAVTDRGTTQLDGKTVRVLESIGDGWIRTVYVDPQTNSPVQITLALIKRPTSKYTYASIQIDTDLDDSLFSLDIPAGYKTTTEAPSTPAKDYNCKMLSKMHYLANTCFQYADKHKGQFPVALSDLKETGMSEQALKALLASPDQPDGPAVILYHRPRVGKDSGNEIVLYEAPGQRRDGGVVVGMWDGHSEVLPQARFEELMK